MTIAAAAFAFVVSLVLTRRLLNPASRGYLLDHPNERSLHSLPTPRGGGLAIASALGLTLPLLALTARSADIGWILAGAAVIVPVAYADDRGHVPARYRLLAQAVAAAVLLFGLGCPESLSLPGARWAWPSPLALIVVGLFVVWMVNLYNFMDGMDGLAAAMAVSGFLTLGILGWHGGAPAYAGFGVVAAAAASGFLVFNYPPARIFMGDVGSTVLGFLAAAMLLWGERDGVVPFWLGALVFSPFILDATLTLLRRLFRRERLWEAHRSHFYQRLVGLGWGHARTLRWACGLMAGCAVSALIAARLPPRGQWGLLAAWAIVYALLIGLLVRRERRVSEIG